MKYIVVVKCHKESLEEEITNLLNAGYECQGGICVTMIFVSERPEGNHSYRFTPSVTTTYSQAMIKKD